MKRILIATFAVLCAVSSAWGQTSQEANKEINDGAAQYRAGNFAEAQRHFERALELDPSQKNAPLFIARALHAQYRPGVDTPENIAKAQEAIEAYKKVLVQNPDDDNSFTAVAVLYRQSKDVQNETDWLMMRANLETAPKEKRSDAYALLASNQWSCSFDITEQSENKKTVQKPDAVVIRYTKPKDESDFFKAQQCATRGMELIEQALSLNPENAKAWSYKTNLFREMAKLMQMEGNQEQQAFYNNQAEESLATHTKLKEQNTLRATGPAGPVVQGSSAGQASNSVSVDDTSSLEANHGKAIVRGGVLNGKAFSKPAPPYPETAKAARASGTVTVQVVVDESGMVITASAVGGHPLLQQAAVDAARQATFAPTLLSGKPVKVSGVITYNFVLQ